MADSIIPAEGEHLTTGWEPDVPAEDTVVRRAVLAQASWAVAVAEALGRPAGRTDRWAAAFIGERGALTNPVIVTAPLPGEAAYAEVLAEVAGTIPDRAPFFMLSPFPAPELSRLGLALVGHPPLMVRFPGGAAPEAAAGVRLREVTTAADLAVAERVLVEGYPMPEVEPLSPGDVLAPPILEGPTRVWLAEVDGSPAAVAAAHVAGGAILVEYVAALASARGRGAASAATWAACLCEPDLPAVLVASDDGRPVYERMGFVAIERWTCWVRPGG